MIPILRLEATCPFCGKTDVTGLRYDRPLGGGTTRLTVKHEDGRECVGTPPSERKALQ